jgi:hypothetical protein
MTTQEQQAMRQKGYVEAMRYIANAKDALKKAGRDGIYFEDAKYVSSASGIAYKGVLTALDAWLQIKGVESPKNERGRKKGKSIDFYRTNLAKLDKKLLRALNVAYDNLHLAGYYDGTLSFGTINDGFKSACELIDLIKPTGAA